MREEQTRDHECSTAIGERLPSLLSSSDPIGTRQTSMYDGPNHTRSHQSRQTSHETSRIEQMTGQDEWPCSVMIASRKSNTGTKGSSSHSSQSLDRDWRKLPRGPFRPPPSASVATKSALRTKRASAMGLSELENTTSPKSSKSSPCRVSFMEPKVEEVAKMTEAEAAASKRNTENELYLLKLSAMMKEYAGRDGRYGQNYWDEVTKTRRALSGLVDAYRRIELGGSTTELGRGSSPWQVNGREARLEAELELQVGAEHGWVKQDKADLSLVELEIV